MIDALISGKLIRDCELKESANGNPYTILWLINNNMVVVICAKVSH